MPGLSGTYFGETLTFICEHNAEGAMGIIVNRPSHVTLVELVAQLGISKGATPIDSVVMEGGPVEVERGFILHSADQRFDASLDLGCGIMLSSAREVLEAIADSDGPDEYLVALGYAGWDAGQLEDEIRLNSWLTVPASPDLVFETPYEERWQAAARSIGINPAKLSLHAGNA